MHELDWLEEDIRKHCKNGTHTDYVMEKFRKFLTKKAEELEKKLTLGWAEKEEIRKILGFEVKEEVKVEKEFWCKEHITERGNWFVTQSGKKIEIHDDWRFCPVCGKERPAPAKKKTLAEVLRDAYVNNHKQSAFTPGDWIWDTVANAALSYFREMVQGQEAKGIFHQSDDKRFIDRDELLRKLAQEAGE